MRKKNPVFRRLVQVGKNVVVVSFKLMNKDLCMVPLIYCNDNPIKSGMDASLEPRGFCAKISNCLRNISTH